MATYTISTAVTTAGTAQLINTGDTVTVTSSGSLNGTGTAGNGIYGGTSAGAHGGFETINVSGTVRGGDYGYWDAGSSGNDTITVNSGGSIFGGSASAGHGAAIYIEAGSNTISNAGNIVNNLDAYGIYLSAGGNTITNSGNIISGYSGGYEAIYVAGGSNAINNSGKIAAVDDYAVYLTGTGHNVISNSGTVSGDYGIYADDGSNSVTNSGTISTSHTGIEVTGSGNSVTNSGTVSILSDDSAIELDGDHNTLTNSGAVTGGTDVGVSFYGTNDAIHNSAAGTISGGDTGIYSDDGKSAVIVNAGAVKGGEYGMYLEDATGAHVKVTGTGSVIGGTGSAIYAYGDDTSGGSHFSGMTFNIKGIVQGTSGIDALYSDNTIKVGAHGSVIGTDGEGIDLSDFSNGAHIFNAGLISGTDSGIYIETGNSVHIHNNGTITGATYTGIYIDDGDNVRITNNGTIFGGGYDGIYIDGSKNIVTNNSGGSIKAVAEHSGNGYGGVWFGDGSNTVNNSGKILLSVNGQTHVAGVFAGDGSNVITNNHGALISDFHAGQTSNYAIWLEDDGNTVTNNGKIVGTVQIGSTGANTYDGSGGRLKGTVTGGTGSDTIILGAGHSSVQGNGGADAITIGSGADNVVYTAVTDSNVTTFDAVDGFTAGTDSFTFNLGGHALNGLDSVTVGSLAGVDPTDVGNAVAGHLDPYGAVVLSVSSGLYAGDVFLIVDHSGTSTFSAANDYFIALTHLSGTLTATDIATY